MTNIANCVKISVMEPKIEIASPVRRLRYDLFMEAAADASCSSDHLTALNFAMQAFDVSIKDTPEYEVAAFAIAGSYCMLTQADLVRINSDAWDDCLKTTEAVGSRIRLIQANPHIAAIIATE